MLSIPAPMTIFSPSEFIIVSLILNTTQEWIDHLVIKMAGSEMYVWNVHSPLIEALCWTSLLKKCKLRNQSRSNPLSTWRDMNGQFEPVHCCLAFNMNKQDSSILTRGAFKTSSWTDSIDITEVIANFWHPHRGITRIRVSKKSNS